MALLGYGAGATEVAAGPLSPVTLSAMHHQAGGAVASRAQVGIERLPTRRTSNEPREAMNCKSCRKRKIKCNRLRPTCEACEAFRCSCVYDAIPKKRGPKTDVLEALLKRVDGLEARLKNRAAAGQQSPIETKLQASIELPAALPASPPPASVPASPPAGLAMLDTYFARFHAKPFCILDEATLRRNQAPVHVMHALYAVAAKHTPHPRGHPAAVKLGDEFAASARAAVDTDEPSVDALQTLLLLVTAATAAGRGKRAYMLLATAVGMAMALELHREVDPAAHTTPVERETRRRLFWTCYLLDRFMACGSKRPALIDDQCVLLRLPCWSPTVEAVFFRAIPGPRRADDRPQDSSGMLIDMTRLLGVTNRYLASGGARADSHFPWHALSNLSEIRHDLDVWASGTEYVFAGLDALLGRRDVAVLVLSKLIYHLVHCLLYRPFLPVDLAELACTSQHQAWQIQATHTCFLHANATAEMVELGNQTAAVEWPAFVGYCICTAATVHIHGAHYRKDRRIGVFAASPALLSRAMQHLAELCYAWASVQHQRETLQSIWSAHAELVKATQHRPTHERFSPMLQLADFADRYASVAASFPLSTASLGLADGPQHAAAPPPGAETAGPKRKSTAAVSGTRPSLKKRLHIDALLPSVLCGPPSSCPPSPRLQQDQLPDPPPQQRCCPLQSWDPMQPPVTATTSDYASPPLLPSSSSGPNTHSTPAEDAPCSVNDPMLGGGGAGAPTSPISSPAPWQSESQRTNHGADLGTSCPSANKHDRSGDARVDDDEREHDGASEAEQRKKCGAASPSSTSSTSTSGGSTSSSRRSCTCPCGAEVESMKNELMDPFVSYLGQLAENALPEGDLDFLW